jgi:hypothetical protein
MHDFKRKAIIEVDKAATSAILGLQPTDLSLLVLEVFCDDVAGSVFLSAGIRQ